MKKKGFTLIEILVVVSIIAILLGVLIPSLNKARAAAQKVICKSNLRQYGVVTEVYLQDNNGVLPDPHHWLFKDPSATEMGQKHCQWHNETLLADGWLWNDGNPGDIHICPMFKRLSKRHAQDHPYHDSSIEIHPKFSYSMNAFLGLKLYNGVEKISQVKRTSDVFIFTEENMWPVPGITDSVLNDTVMLTRYPPYTSTDICDTFGTLHDTRGGDLTTGVANLVYLDGHVDSVHIGKEDIDKAFRLSWPKRYLPSKYAQKGQ